MRKLHGFPTKMNRDFVVPKRCTALHSIVRIFMKFTRISFILVGKVNVFERVLQDAKTTCKQTVSAIWETRSGTAWIPNENAPDFGDFAGNRFISIG